MQVRHRLRITVCISLVSALAILLLFALTLFRINQLNQASRVISEIITDSFERIILRNDYVQSNNPQAQRQWFAKHGEIGRELDIAAGLFHGTELSNLAQMRSDHEAIGRIFSSIMAQRTDGTAGRTDEDRLTAQLNQRCFSVVTQARQLLDNIRTDRHRTISGASFGVLALLALIVATTVFNARSMGRMVAQRVKRLRDSAAIIGGGDLEHRVELSGQDEFREIGEALNTMTIRLRELYRDLTTEIEERRRVEAQLTESRLAAVSLLEETEAARRQSEEANTELETFFGAIQDAVLIYDDEMRVRKVNKMFQPTYGFDPVGLHVSQIIEQTRCRNLDGRALHLAEQPTLQALEGDTTLNRLFRISLPNGTDAIVETSSTPLTMGNRIVGCVTVWHDISKRIRAERALGESEERYRGLVELAPFAIFVNRNNHIEYINPAGLRLFDVESPGDILGRSPLDFIHPEDRPGAIERIGRLLAGGGPTLAMARIVRRNGAVRIAEVAATSCIDSQGVAIQVMMNDITERKLTEDALSVSEERLRFHLDNSPLAVIEWDRDFVVTRWTGASELLFGWSAEEIVGRPLTDLNMVLEDDLPLVQDVMRQLREGKSLQIVSTNRNYTRRGDVRYCTWYNSVLVDEQGRMASVLSKVIDITDRKQAEERLALLASTAETLLGSAEPQMALEGLCRQAMALLDCQAFFNYLADHQADCLRLNACSGIPTDEVARIKRLEFGAAVCGCVARDGARIVVDDIGQNPDPRTDLVASYGIAAYACHPLLAGDEVLGTLSFGTRTRTAFSEDDLAVMKTVANLVSIALQRKRSEDGLRQAHDLLEEQVVERTRELHEALTNVQREMHDRLTAEADAREKERMLIQQSRQAALGEMIGNIAHQWRQPLNNLALLVQQMTQFHKAGRFDGAYLDSSVNKAMELITHMSHTIDDFRLFFRPDRQPVEFSVADALERSISLIRDSFGSQRIAIETNLEPGCCITGYPNEFAQSILNILVNARDALCERDVTAPRIAVRCRRENDRGVVTIADNAGGIPEEIMANIFDPYFSTKGPQQGTGIGLFMTRTIIEKNMGGTITVRNTGEGAEFRIEV